MLNRLMLAGAMVGAAIVANVGVSAQQASPLTDEEYARQALAAGPESVAKGAAVVRPEPDGTMKTIRQGTNGFSCLIMGTDRMCADKNSMEFLHAVMSHKTPPDQFGVAYMLGGDRGPSGETGGACNTSPYATNKDPNCHWIITGPHIMLLGPPSKKLGYTEAPDPDATKPYMMWANTPYEHAMIPVK